MGLHRGQGRLTQSEVAEGKPAHPARRALGGEHEPAVGVVGDPTREGERLPANGAQRGDYALGRVSRYRP